MFLAVTTTFKFSGMVSLSVAQRKRRDLFEVLRKEIFDQNNPILKGKRQILQGGIDTSSLDTEVETFFKTEGASAVTLDWIL